MLRLRCSISYVLQHVKECDEGPPTILTKIDDSEGFEHEISEMTTKMLAAQAKNDEIMKESKLNHERYFTSSSAVTESFLVDMHGSIAIILSALK
jgi:hypothetical protein